VCARCSACPGPVVTPCGPLADAVCGKTAACPAPAPPTYQWWMLNGTVPSADFTCPRAGYYLAAFAPGATPPAQARTCLPCPDGMVGLDGVLCVACPARQTALSDHGSCACLPPGVLNATGGCECPDGLLPTASGCQACPPNTYGAGGACWACPAGAYSNASATACVGCPVGSYRGAGQAQCLSCGPGSYPTDPGDPGSCVSCVQAGACGLGLQQTPCPVSDSLVWCAPCPGLPPGADWLPAGGACAYRCQSGYYHTGVGCAACNVTACPPGAVLSPCTSFQDGNCDQPCENATMPSQNAVWAGGCGWACEPGYVPVLQDYWMFQYYLCWPS